MSSTKKPEDTDIHGPTYRPGDPDRDSATPPSSTRNVVEGDDIPATGDGATREKLGDYLSSITKVNKYGPSPGSTPAVSHRDQAGAPPIYDSYKKGGAVNGAGSNQTFFDEVLEQSKKYTHHPDAEEPGESGHGVTEKDLTLVGVSEYKNPKVNRGDINPFVAKDGAEPVYKKGVQESRGSGHTLLASVPGHVNPEFYNIPSQGVGYTVKPGPHVIQQRTSDVLKNNRFHPAEGSPYLKGGKFTHGPGAEGGTSMGTMGSNQKILGTYDPDAQRYDIQNLIDIGRRIMVEGTGHDADWIEDLIQLLPSLTQMGIPGVNVDVIDLNAVNVLQGYSRTSGGYLLAPSNADAYGTSEAANADKHYQNEITSKNSFGHLNSYLEKFTSALPMGMIMVALGGLIALLIQAAILYGIVMLLQIVAAPSAIRRNPEVPTTLPLGKRQHVPQWNALSAPILGWLGIPELEGTGDLWDCMLRGVGSFFGVPNMSGVPGPGDLLKMADALMEQGGYVASLMKSITRDLEDVADAALQIRGSLFSIVGGIIAVIKSLGDARSIKFLMTCAKLGDLMFIGDSYTFAPYPADPDALKETPAARLAKSRVSSTDPTSVLRHGALPSRYLLPVSVTRAALQYELRGGQGFEALQPLVDKIVPNKDAATNRIGRDYVKEIEDKLDCEYVPFYFQDLRTNEIVAFHAFLDSISDDYSPEWSTTAGYGRMDPVQIFNRTTRAVSITFMVASTNPSDFDEMWFSINKLTTLVYPQWTSGTAMVDADKNAFIMPFSQVPAGSPILRLRIGDLIKNNYSRFNLARIFGIGEADKAGGKFAIAQADKTSDAEGVDYGAAGTKLQEYMTKLRIPPKDIADSENGYANGATAILRANVGTTTVIKEKKPDDFFESQYVEVSVPTVVEIDKKGIQNVIPIINPSPEGQEPMYLCKFVADSPAAKVYGDGFWVSHKMLSHDPAQVAKDNDLSLLDAELDLTKDPDPKSNRGFFHPKNNAITRAFESTAGRGLGCVCTSLSYDYADAPWETRKLGSRAPMWVKVSMSFNIIHDLPPGLDSSGFNRAPLYNVGDIMNNLSGPDIHQTEVTYAKDPLRVLWDTQFSDKDGDAQPKNAEANGKKAGK